MLKSKLMEQNENELLTKFNECIVRVWHSEAVKIGQVAQCPFVDCLQPKMSEQIQRMFHNPSGVTLHTRMGCKH